MRQALSKEKLLEVYGHLAKQYDLQHALITANTDQLGRRLLVEKAVRGGDDVLDCGAGTGATGVLTAEKVGDLGRVTLFDLSDDMLAIARQKAAGEKLLGRLTFKVGDMENLPFADDSFDVVLSTYSLCPLFDPIKGAQEMYRVCKPGGNVGAAHSTTPRNSIVKWLADSVESIAWHFPWLSMGCRPVSVLPALKAARAEVIFVKKSGPNGVRLEHRI